jgi:hypothetical protein
MVRLIWLVVRGSYHHTENDRNGERLERSLPNQLGKDIEWHVRLPGGFNSLPDTATSTLKSFAAWSTVDFGSSEAVPPASNAFNASSSSPISDPPGLTQWKRRANVPTGRLQGLAGFRRGR